MKVNGKDDNPYMFQTTNQYLIISNPWSFCGAAVPHPWAKVPPLAAQIHLFPQEMTKWPTHSSTDLWKIVGNGWFSGRKQLSILLVRVLGGDWWLLDVDVSLRLHAYKSYSCLLGAPWDLQHRAEWSEWLWILGHAGDGQHDVSTIDLTWQWSTSAPQRIVRPAKE